MDGMRVAPEQSRPAVLPCCRCGNSGRSWDRVAGKAYCPECQEALVQGLAAPVAERAEKRPCAACGRVGTVRYLTFPLHGPTPVELSLCPEHLHGLVGRRLGTHAFRLLRRKLRVLGIDVGEVFLLHDAFYDRQGRALQPATEPD
jgi:hypothetical protein